jgi:beta-alanine--pyruvate transaminase
MAAHFEHAVHSLKGVPHVIDVRNFGLMAGIELESRPGKPGARAFDAFLRCFEQGVLVRTTGDIIALSPPLIINRQQIDDLTGTLDRVLRALD